MNNFAVLTIAYSPAPTTLPLSIETNNPCHLTCYYTDKKPGSHRTARNQRGLTLPWGVYYCFVAWQSVEQTEPGDTLTHTFEIPDWSYCQTKWFAFRGTVAGEASPSVSCIFKKHHPGTLPFLNGDFELWPDPAKAPTYWRKDTANPGFSNWVRETTYVYSGRYAARLESSGRNHWTMLRQEVYADPYRGKTVKFTGSNLCINIYYGQIAYWASGPGSWSQLHRFTTHAGWRHRSYTHYIDPLATKIGISVSLNANSDVLRTIIWDKTDIEILG
ncbi:hypothetical protein ES708_32446 [subsurface metagenome]